MDIKFKTSDNNTFAAEGTGTDYDGSLFTAKLTGTYDKKENRIIENLLFPFGIILIQNAKILDVELKEDDTGYHNMQKIIDNGGCNVQIRLVNLENNG